MSVRINTKDDLVKLASRLGVRKDWHEPDEQDIVAECFGRSFDNAGFWGFEYLNGRRGGNNGGGIHPEACEMYVALFQHGELVAEVNLALLFAWATGYQYPHPTASAG